MRNLKYYLALLLFFLSCSCAQETVKIGFVAGLTGPQSGLGIAGRNAVEYILLKENILSDAGMKFELLVRDDSNTASGAALAVRDLVDNGCNLIIGPMTSNEAEGAVPVARELGVLLLAPTVSSFPRQGADDFYFPLSPDAGEIGRQTGVWCQAEGQVRVAALLESGNILYGEKFLAGFRLGLGPSGDCRTFVFSGKETKGHYSELLDQVLGSNPDALLVIAAGLDTARLAQALAKQGGPSQLYTVSWALTQDLIEHGGRSIEGLRALSGWSSETDRPEWLTFKEGFQQFFGHDPGFPESYAADAARLGLAAIKKARSRTVEAIKLALAEVLDNFEGLHCDFILDSNGFAQRELFRVTVRSTKFVRQK